MNLDQLEEELTCPLTLTLLANPITLPCCGKAVSRSALHSALQSNPSCPLCRTEILVETAETLPRNRIAQALVDAFVAATHTDDVPPATMTMLTGEDETPKLTATFCLLPVPTPSTPAGSTMTPSDDPPQRQRQRSDQSMASAASSTRTMVGRIGRLQLKVSNATRLNFRRNLCILVVDKSGSMSGSPWHQATLAMKHIVTMARELSHFAANTTLKIVCYDARASELNCDEGSSVDTIHSRIQHTQAGGSTSFRAAFQETVQVMRRTVSRGADLIQQGQVPEGTVSPMPAVVQILFMTDGQAHEDRTRLAEELREQLVKFRADCASSAGVVVPDVTVHAVGFSSGCDRALLDRIRHAGTHPGQFRYCEPGDSEDALCGRLTGMFEAMAAHGGCELLVERLSLPSEPVVNVGAEDEEESTERPAPWEFLGQDGETLPLDENGRVRLQLRTKPDGVGTAVSWVSINASPEATGLVLPMSVTCNSGQDVDVPGDDTPVETGPNVSSRPDFTVTAREDSSFSPLDAVKRAWVGVRLHVIAESAIACATAATNQSTPLPDEAVRLWGAFLEHRLRAVSALGSDAHGRVPGLLEQLRSLSNWKRSNDRSVLSIGRLRDLSSASAFSSSRAPVARSTPVARERPTAAEQVVSIDPGTEVRSTAALDHGEEEIFYSESNKSNRRNPLQSAIVNWGQHKAADTMVCDILDSMDMESRKAAIVAVDHDGNSALHLAAYHGQFDAIPVLLEALPFFDVDAPNDFGETPITIAIKRRGYHKTVEVLQGLGGSIPEDRLDGLIAFCMRYNYPRTAAYLQKAQREGTLGPTGETRVNDKTTPLWTPQSAAELPALVFEEGTSHAVIQLRLRDALAQGRPVDWVSLVRTALQFPDRDLLKSGLEHISLHDVDPAWVFSYCFPQKPDADDTPMFLDVLKLMVEFSPSVLDASLPDSGDTLLHRAITAGSLPHTEYLVARGLDPDVTNMLGNTPLIVSCIKRYPCTVDFLVTSGANVNVRNKNGMTPVGMAVQMGSLRIVESLVAAGATLDGPTVVTNRGENLLHVAVRNNRSDILELLVDQADPSTLLEVDENGFTPILAAIEGNRKECLNLLLDAATDYMQRGIPGFSHDETEDAANSELPILEWKTPADSPVIPGATAVHVAVYYSRMLALSMLLGRGADPNALDGSGLTPLHRASQSGSVDIVSALIANGADPTATDKDGQTPASFATTFPEVTAALVGPLPGPLLAFAAGDMEARAMSACLDIIKRASAIAAEPGHFDASRVLDLTLDDIGQTALMIAVSHANVAAASVLFEGGASPKRRDRRGLSAAAWAQMVKSQRLLGILGTPSQPLLPPVQRHREWDGVDAMAIFLGGRVDPSLPSPTSKTTLHYRIVLLAEAFTKARSSGIEEKSATSTALTLLQAAPRTGSVDRVMIAPPRSAEQSALEADRRSCKIAAAGSIAGGSSLPPRHIFAALLATKHGPLVPNVNKFLDAAPSSPTEVPMTNKAMLDFAVALFDCISIDPTTGPYMKEVYAVGPPGLAPSALSEGTEVTLNGFASATTEWPLALLALDTCHRKKEESKESSEVGTRIALAIKTRRSLRKLWECSAFPEDREIIFLPGTKFRVSWLCTGDLRLLRRPENRKKTARVEGGDISELSEEGSLLVEVEEF